MTICSKKLIVLSDNELCVSALDWSKIRDGITKHSILYQESKIKKIVSFEIASCILELPEA